MPESDLKEKMVQYPSEGVTVRAFAVAPSVKERRPAIILVQEWWGLNDHMKDVARRYAKEGYVALVPDLFSRLGNRVTTDANEAGKLMNALPQADGLTDLQASIAFLKTAPEVEGSKIGVTGFCMGGSYALMLPCVSTYFQPSGSRGWDSLTRFGFSRTVSPGRIRPFSGFQ